MQLEQETPNDQLEKKKKESTFKIPNRRTKYADKNVAATPMKAHSPLKPPMIDGFRPDTYRSPSQGAISEKRQAEVSGSEV